MTSGSLLTSLLAALGLGGAGAPAPSAPTPVVGTAARPFTAADALHVKTGPLGRRDLVTKDGRTVFLRGANVNALIDYQGSRQVVPVTPRDGEQARALGFSVIRLAVSWSKIEPQPGTFDAAYLDTVRKTAKVFADQGIYVLLDLHQDRYGAGMGPSGDESDGAPTWAQKTDGASTAAGSGGS